MFALMYRFIMYIYMYSIIIVITNLGVVNVYSVGLRGVDDHSRTVVYLPEGVWGTCNRASYVIRTAYINVGGCVCICVVICEGVCEGVY